MIKALEERGIGRPSTYAATISTIIDRGYVTVVERRLQPEYVGEVVTDLLVEHFGSFVDYDFTARMEEDLDEIASGKREWVPLLREFYDPFVELVSLKSEELKRSDFTTEETDEVCSEGHPMVIRLGRNGRFLACSKYPEHKETRPLPGEEAEQAAVEGVGETCPQCNEGTLVARRGRFGAFAGCSRYPDCNYIRKTGPPPPEPLGIRGCLPQVRRGPPDRAPSATDRVGVLRLLALSQVRLHVVARAGRRAARRRRRPGRARRRGRHLSQVRCAGGPARSRDPRREAGRWRSQP